MWGIVRNSVCDCKFISTANRVHGDNPGLSNKTPTKPVEKRSLSGLRSLSKKSKQLNKEQKPQRKPIKNEPVAHPNPYQLRSVVITAPPIIKKPNFPPKTILISRQPYEIGHSPRNSLQSFPPASEYFHTVVSQMNNSNTKVEAKEIEVADKQNMATRRCSKINTSDEDSESKTENSKCFSSLSVKSKPISFTELEWTLSSNKPLIRASENPKKLSKKIEDFCPKSVYSTGQNRSDISQSSRVIESFKFGSRCSESESGNA